MKRIGIHAALICLVFSAGCASRRPNWQVGVSWKDLSPESLANLKAAGVDCIELTLSDLMKVPAEKRPERCEQIVRDARAAGVQIWSAHIPFGKGWDISVTDPAQRELAMKNNRQALELCRMLRPVKAVIHASAEPITDSERQARLNASKASLVALNAEFRAIGVQLALEDLPRTCLGNTSAEILWLTDGIDGIGVCFDTNHLLKEGHREFIRKVGSRIVTLHVSDYDGKDERHWMAGEGIIKWNEVTAGLMDAGYQGPFMYETGKHRDGRPIERAEYVAFKNRLRG